jgi:hypothetical protein
MLEFERWMVHYKGPELKRVEPTLVGGEKEIVPLFHDESCFHTNDALSSAWWLIPFISRHLSDHHSG